MEDNQQVTPQQKGFEEAMNVCTRQGKKLKVDMKFRDTGMSFELDCVDKNV